MELNQVLVMRHYKDGAVLDTECYNFELPVYVDHNNAAPGFGWSDDPFPTVGEAGNSISARFTDGACAEEQLLIEVTPGDYFESSTIDTKVVIEAVGGTARIGNP